MIVLRHGQLLLVHSLGTSKQNGGRGDSVEEKRRSSKETLEAGA